MSDTLLLSLIVFVPIIGAVILLFVPPRYEELVKQISFVATVVTFLLTLLLLAQYLQAPGVMEKPLLERALEAKPPKQGPYKDKNPHDLVFRYPWIRVFNVEYYMGVDGINLPLVLLTSLISMLAMLASWNIGRYVRGYCTLFLLLETGMLGTFLALDFLLLYVFWEVMLLPMYFLIGLWGAPSRVERDGRVRGGPYAAIKFFLYTLAGSVLMLLAMLAFYFYPVPLQAGSAPPAQEPAVAAAAPMANEAAAELAREPAYSFDIIQMHQWALGGQKVYGRTFQLIMFLLLYVGFAIKLPLFPFHTWLPDAHVDAPTPISMILAGILLKMGGYGFARLAYPMCPEGAYALAWPLAFIGVWNIIYGALTAMAQTDFKRLVAYSSISHMGYVMLGFAVWSLPGLKAEIWAMGFNGAMFQMIAHGISSAGMFFMVGVIYDRLHHRDLNRLGGLANMMPVYAGLSAWIFFAALGLPGLCGFVGEVMTVIATWQFSRVFAAVAAAGVILTAGYILWTLQRVFLGTSEVLEAQLHRGQTLPDMTLREVVCAVPLVVFAVLLGVYPRTIFSFMEPSVTQLVQALDRTADLVAWLVAPFGTWLAG